MLFVYLGIYTFILTLVWGLFFISRLHSYKFKNFSHHIVKVTNVLFVFLLTLTLLGYIFIFTQYDSQTTASLDFSNGNNDYTQIDY